MATEGHQSASSRMPHEWFLASAGRWILAYLLVQVLWSGMVWLVSGSGNPLVEIMASLALSLGFLIVERTHSRPSWAYILASTMAAFLAVTLLRGLGAAAESWAGTAPVLEVLAASFFVEWLVALMAWRGHWYRQGGYPTDVAIVDLEAGHCYSQGSSGNLAPGESPRDRRLSCLLYLLPLGPAIGLLLYRAGFASIVVPVLVFSLIALFVALSGKLASLAILLFEVERNTGVRLRFYWAPPVSKRPRSIPPQIHGA